MKKTLFAVALIGAVSASQAVDIATWTFETSIPSTAGPHAAEIGVGDAIGFHASTAAVYSNPVGNGSAESFSSNGWAIGDYYQFHVSTVGLQGVTLTFDQASSNTGPRDFQVQYSTDGSTFSNFGAVYAVLANASPNPTWSSVSGSPLYTLAFNLSSVSALDNQANVYLRLTMATDVAANGTTVAATGTDRIDNVTVAASAVPEPASMAALGLGVAALLRRRKK